MNRVAQFRIAACPENSDISEQWSFYILNDGETTLNSVILESIEWEWGNQSDFIYPDVKIINLASNANAFLCRSDDHEVRMSLQLRIRVNEVDENYSIKFPLLYKRRNDLSLVVGLGKDGIVEVARHKVC